MRRSDMRVTGGGSGAVLLLAVAFLTLAASASAATRTDAVERYASAYAVEQEWLKSEPPTFEHGDFRRSYWTLHYLANPAPGSEHCFDDIIYVDSCPVKFYEDDGPFWMDVDALVVRCGPGWFVVSTPLERGVCRSVLRWG